jgi:phosphoglycolate phosphatase
VNVTLLIDLDGTLTDPKTGIVRCINYALAKLGQPTQEPDALEWCIGPPLKDSFETLLGDQKNRAEEAVEFYRERYSETGIYENELYDGIVECLQALRPKCRLFVATSKPTVFAEEVLRHFKIHGYFEAICGSELDGTRSDKAELIKSVLENHALKSSLTSMIGDRKFDLAGAARNGINGLGVSWGYGSRQELTEAGARVIFDHPTDIVAYFRVPVLT